MGYASFKNAKTLIPGSEKTADFGWSVAMSGDIVVVGEGSGGTTSITSKNCYVFTREKGELKYLQTLESEDKGAVSFGYDVAIDGAHIVVGAPLETVGSNAGAGKAYFFTKKGTKFVRNSEALVSENPTPSGLFGASVAIDGVHIVSGATVEVNKNGGTGNAYAFTKQV